MDIIKKTKNNISPQQEPRDAVGEITIDEIVDSTGGLVTDLQPEDRLYMEKVVDGKYEARATTVGSIVSKTIDQIEDEIVSLVFNWDVTTDGVDIDCLQIQIIDKRYKTLHLVNLKIGDIIHVFNLSESNIRKISIEPTEVFTVTSDITYNNNSATGDNNLLNRSTIQSPISFFKDANITEIFSTNIIIYKEIALGDATIPMYMLDGDTFSIEFSEDLTKIVGYFNIDEFFVPWTYVSSTGVATFLSDTMIFCLKNNDNNALFTSVNSSAVYKLGKISSNAHIVYNTNTLLDSLHHIPVISVSGSINGLVGNSMTNLIILLRSYIGDLNSGSVDQVVSVYTEIANFYKVSKYNSNLTKEILRVYRDLMNGGQIVTEETSHTTVESRINCFGTHVHLSKTYTTTAIIQGGEISISNGIWVQTTSSVPHAMGTVTYFEKGEFSFPVSINEKN
ncbi:hypothetical protein [Romboutsia sp.]|uniref:hypothetical protein n=1 Tax=Romboutsia sp. TaxID=1965302 RepID=UPI003F2BDD7B